MIGFGIAIENQGASCHKSQPQTLEPPRSAQTYRGGRRDSSMQFLK